MRSVVIIVLLCASAAAAQPIDTTVCAIGAAPEAFDGKTVRVRATVLAGFEVFAIRDRDVESCHSMWLQIPNGAGAGVKELADAVDAQMYPRRRDIVVVGANRYRVSATMTGQVEYSRLGFGHMNAYRTRFILQSASDIEREDLAPTYDLSELSPTPVRLPTASLRGQLLAPDGTPIRDAAVDINGPDDWERWDFAFTDDDGKFSFDGEPGKYRVGINLDTPPSPKLPYVKTELPEITVVDGQRMEDLTIRPDAALTPRHVPVQVIWPDGTPVEEANVWLTEMEHPTAVVGLAVSHTDASGAFDLIGFTGRDYVVHADIYTQPSYSPHCADKVLLCHDDQQPKPLVMVVTGSGATCRNAD